MHTATTLMTPVDYWNVYFMELAPTVGTSLFSGREFTGRHARPPRDAGFEHAGGVNFKIRQVAGVQLDSEDHLLFLYLLQSVGGQYAATRNAAVLSAEVNVSHLARRVYNAPAGSGQVHLNYRKRVYRALRRLFGAHVQLWIFDEASGGSWRTAEFRLLDYLETPNLVGVPAGTPDEEEARGASDCHVVRLNAAYIELGMEFGFTRLLQKDVERLGGTLACLLYAYIRHFPANAKRSTLAVSRALEYCGLMPEGQGTRTPGEPDDVRRQRLASVKKLEDAAKKVTEALVQRYTATYAPLVLTDAETAALTCQVVSGSLKLPDERTAKASLEQRQAAAKPAKQSPRPRIPKAKNSAELRAEAAKMHGLACYLSNLAESTAIAEQDKQAAVVARPIAQVPFAGD